MQPGDRPGSRCREPAGDLGRATSPKGADLSWTAEQGNMTARFNHTIIAAKSRHESADFYGQILEANDAPAFNP